MSAGGGTGNVIFTKVIGLVNIRSISGKLNIVRRQLTGSYLGTKFS